MNNEETIFRTLRDIIKKKANIEEELITPESNFRDDLQINSIVTLSIVLAIETKFEVEISDEDNMNLPTVGDAVRLIASKKL